MAIISSVDLQTSLSEVWQQLQEGGDLIVTSSGRALALMIATEGQDVEELLLTLRRVRAQMALTRLRQQAADNGLDQLTLDEINAEIEAVRRERQ